MRIRPQYFDSGKFAGWLIFWSNYKYRTYIRRITKWHDYPKDKPRLIVGKPWWSHGGLMLWRSRIEWSTIRWVTGPESYVVVQGDPTPADNLYAKRP